MRISRPYPVVPALLGALLLAACTAPDNSPAPAFAGSGETHTITVERRDITSVVTVEANVAASPTFVVVAPRAGTVRYTGRKTGEVARVHGSDANQAVTLPANATLRRRLVSSGAKVPAGLPIAEASFTGFALSATIPTTSLYRFYGTIGPVRAQIDQGPGPFDCPLLGALSPAADAGETGGGELVGPGEANNPASEVVGDGAAGSRLLCAPPDDLRLIVGSRAIVAVVTGEVRDALALPVEAVAGLVDRGTVLLQLGDKRTERREVKLGITDGLFVEITSGLAAGDRVVTPAPDLGLR